MSTRTVTSGAGSDWRFTPTAPDALNVPATGIVTGRPPCIWATGGGIRANADPAATGFDRILDYVCDNRGYSFAQIDVPWYLANDGVQPRVDDCLDWLRDPGNPVQATNDDPIFIGFSNGAICALRYGRDNNYTAAALCLPPVDNDRVYTTDYGGGQEVFEHGNPAVPGGGWGPYIPALDPYTAGDHLPTRGQPWGNESEYLHLGRQTLAFYSASDYIFAPQDMGFYTMIGATMVNIGPIGHVGTWSSIWLGETGPADLIDVEVMGDFFDAAVAAL